MLESRKILEIELLIDQTITIIDLLLCLTTLKSVLLAAVQRSPTANFEVGAAVPAYSAMHAPVFARMW